MHAKPWDDAGVRSVHFRRDCDIQHAGVSMPAPIHKWVDGEATGREPQGLAIAKSSPPQSYAVSLP